MAEAPTILVVDDEARVRRLMARLLEVYTDWKVLQAALPELEDALEAGVDAVVCDVRLGDALADEIFDRLATRFPRLKVLYVTGDAGHYERLLLLGQRVLMKPFGVNDAIRWLKRLLEEG